jgi:hypothetical protein
MTDIFLGLMYLSGIYILITMIYLIVKDEIDRR